MKVSFNDLKLARISTFKQGFQGGDVKHLLTSRYVFIICIPYVLNLYFDRKKSMKINIFAFIVQTIFFFAQGRASPDSSKNIVMDGHLIVDIELDYQNSLAKYCVFHPANFPFWANFVLERVRNRKTYFHITHILYVFNT